MNKFIGLSDKLYKRLYNKGKGMSEEKSYILTNILTSLEIIN
jgi:hypothetical protein